MNQIIFKSLNSLTEAWSMDLKRKVSFGFDPWPRSVGWGSSVAVSCGVGCRLSWDLALLWLWGRLAATAPIGPLAWEPLYIETAALKDKKTKKKECRFTLMDSINLSQRKNTPEISVQRARQMTQLYQQ